MTYIRSALHRTPLLFAWGWVKKWFCQPQSQNNEAEILDELVHRYAVPRTFVEFGFGAWEFNCAGLIRGFEGLLIDGNRRAVRYARMVLPRNISCECQWLDLEHLAIIRNFAQKKPLGILSVDVDGNDYWILRALIDLNPALVIVEFNPTFGLEPISVPYDATFTGFSKHASGFYYGASLAAMNHLCRKHGYTLVALSTPIVNAFFIRDDLLESATYGADFFTECAPAIRALALDPQSDLFDLPLVDVTK